MKPAPIKIPCPDRVSFPEAWILDEELPCPDERPAQTRLQLGHSQRPWVHLPENDYLMTWAVENIVDIVLLVSRRIFAHVWNLGVGNDHVVQAEHV